MGVIMGGIKDFAKFVMYPRLLVYLKQIRDELKRSNDIKLATMISTDQRAYHNYQSIISGRPISNPKLVDIHKPTTAELTNSYRRRNPKSIDDLE
jgi:hypothetical protein